MLENSTAVAGHLSGDLDANLTTGGINPDMLALYNGSESRIEIVPVEVFSYYYMGFQCGEDSPFADINVRKAFECAIDRQTILDSIMGGVCKSVIPKGVLGYDENLPDYPYDPEMATVFMDINMPGLNMVWVDAAEGSFAAPATVNVVKGCQNPELAQLFVEYMISDEVQSRVAETMNEAPVNKNATMPEELKTYLAFGENAMSALKQFDETYIASAKDGWIDTFQRTVNVQ